jgi:hypothetical protein
MVPLSADGVAALADFVYNLGAGNDYLLQEGLLVARPIRR